ncbi:MAG: NAD(P)H-dependent oxidoreductase subunit E [Deltaproteobacteria bacterium]|nr:NAD(P)H-dependent oxidoreductase subunit E [Deltaproteobacteria bacterium]
MGVEFTAEQWGQIDGILEKNRNKPGVLILVLEEIQELVGFLPESLQRRIAIGLDVPLSQVYGVVTFYSFFTMKPRGKHEIKVCLGTACHVRGGQRVLEKIEQKLQIGPGDCTEDRNYSLDIVRCIGACGVAPVMVVGKDVHKQVKPAKMDLILGKYQK